MAQNQLPFMVALEKNNNQFSHSYGKYYAKAYSPNEALNLKSLCERVALDQSVFTPEIAQGVITKSWVITINTSTASADAIQKGLWICWTKKGKAHNIKCGVSTIVAAA